MTDLADDTLIAVAKAIATIAHRGQTDKAGEPYIDHPRRVAERILETQKTYRPETIATAWLHDVLEDTGITRDHLRAAGIPGGVIADVERLTRIEGEKPEDYYERVADGFFATQVKLADIADNTDTERLALLDDGTIVRLVRKYAKALMLIKGEQ